MNKLTGGRWSLGKADKMRKIKDLEDYRDDFVLCCVKNEVNKDVANLIFSRFSLEYSFNKSHATSYAVTTAQTAWLKGKYRKEFMAALMSVYIANTDDIPIYIKECQRHGIQMLPPEINSSTNLFVTTGNNIRMPFSAIKGVGDAAVEVILHVRHGEFTGFADFLSRTRHRAVNKKVVIALIKAGCFDLFQPNRNLLIGEYLTSRDETQPLMTWCSEICIHYELETLGIALTKHPLDGYVIPQFTNQQDGECWTGGTVTKVTQIVDKNSKNMAFVTIENKTDVVECIVFAYVYSKVKTLLIQNNIIKVTGRKEGSKIIANTIELL
jgi:DNA polymerase-3 subunit alpha